MSNYKKRTQEQLVAGLVHTMNKTRDGMKNAAMKIQDQCYESAKQELQQLKDFVGEPDKILGSVATKHGEIAEHAHVRICNARRLVKGLPKEYTFSGVKRTAPEDFLKNGKPVQMKFLNGISSTLNGNGNADGVVQHSDKYSEFVKKGGSYIIPREQYYEGKDLEFLRDNDYSSLRRADIKKLRSIKACEEKGLKLGVNVKPAIVDYKDVQQAKIHETIAREDNIIMCKDKERRDYINKKYQPSLKEGAKAAAIGATLGGSVALVSKIRQKRKEGKRYSEFTTDDWKEIGLSTADNSLKEGIRGAAVYSLSNFSQTPESVACGLVTAGYGVIEQTKLFREGKINKNEFVFNIEDLCLETSVSTIASVIGQVAIPVPVVGALVGNTVGMLMYDLVETYSSERERRLIENYMDEMKTMCKDLDEKHSALLRAMDAEIREYKSKMIHAFATDMDVAKQGSIEFARYVGVSEDRLMKGKNDMDKFFYMN